MPNITCLKSFDKTYTYQKCTCNFKIVCNIIADWKSIKISIEYKLDYNQNSMKCQHNKKSFV